MPTTHRYPHGPRSVSVGEIGVRPALPAVGPTRLDGRASVLYPVLILSSSKACSSHFETCSFAPKLVHSRKACWFYQSLIDTATMSGCQTVVLPAIVFLDLHLDPVDCQSAIETSPERPAVDFSSPGSAGCATCIWAAFVRTMSKEASGETGRALLTLSLRSHRITTALHPHSYASTSGQSGWRRIEDVAV